MVPKYDAVLVEARSTTKAPYVVIVNNATAWHNNTGTATTKTEKVTLLT